MVNLLCGSDCRGGQLECNSVQQPEAVGGSSLFDAFNAFDPALQLKDQITPGLGSHHAAHGELHADIGIAQIAEDPSAKSNHGISNLSGNANIGRLPEAPVDPPIIDDIDGGDITYLASHEFRERARKKRCPDAAQKIGGE